MGICMGDCNPSPRHEVELPDNICNVYFPVSKYCCEHPEGHDRAIERSVNLEFNRAKSKYFGSAPNDRDAPGN